jgi:hypothetical protein
MTRTDPVPPPEQPKSDSENRLNALWADMLFDACASDGPIRDNDVREAMKRGRPKIEAEARASAHRAERARIGGQLAHYDLSDDPGYIRVAIERVRAILDAVATDTPEEPQP